MFFIVNMWCIQISCSGFNVLADEGPYPKRFETTITWHVLFMFCFSLDTHFLQYSLLMCHAAHWYLPLHYYILPYSYVRNIGYQ